MFCTKYANFGNNNDFITVTFPKMDKFRLLNSFVRVLKSEILFNSTFSNSKEGIKEYLVELMGEKSYKEFILVGYFFILNNIKNYKQI